MQNKLKRTVMNIKTFSKDTSQKMQMHLEKKTKSKSTCIS